MDDTAEEQFQAFVAASSRSLMRLAYLLTQDRHHAEDLVQSALLRAYRNWGRVGQVERPEAYVHKILVNERRMWWRRRRVDESLRADVPDQPTRDVAIGVDDRDALWRELGRLPPRTRAVLVLRYWEDYSEGDTANLLGCSTGTVKSHASRGLRQLRAYLVSAEHAEQPALPERSAPISTVAKGTAP